MPGPLTGIDQRATYRDVWTSQDTFATTLAVLFVDTYGTAGFQWEPETIVLDIQDDFGLVLPQANFDRLMAARAIITGNDFFQSLPDFVDLCNVLYGSTYNPALWDPAESKEVAWGITEAILLSPPQEDEPFTEEIRSYIAQVLDAEGIMQPPDILRLALRSDDPTAFVQGEYSDDPQMFSMIYGFEQGKTDDINQLVRASIQALSAQLDRLPLRGGTTGDAVQRLLRAVA